MKRSFIFELNRFKRERVFLFTLLLIVLSLYLSFQGVKVYKDYQKDVIKPFQNIEAEIYRTINNYTVYSIKGFSTLIEPSTSSISIKPEAYEFVTKSKIDINQDNRLVESRSKKKILQIPLLLILMVCGFYYGVTFTFVEGRGVKNFLARLSLLSIGLLLVVFARLVPFLYVPVSMRDIYIALTYWSVVALFTFISYTFGVVARIYKMKKGVAVFSFVILLSLLHLSSVFSSPKPLDLDGKIQFDKFKRMLSVQTQEDKKLIGIKDKEKVKSMRLGIVKSFVENIYPQMVKMQKEYIGEVKKDFLKSANLSLISPLAYNSVLKDMGASGNRYKLAMDMVDLEFDFLKYAWSQLYSPDKPPVIQFEGSKENTYQSKAILPHNFWLGAFIYSSIFILVSGFVFFKLTRKPVPLEELKMRPGFLYREEMPDDIRARVKANAIAHGYFCIDDESIASYPGELTFSEIFSLNFYTKELLTEKVGDFFNTKLKNLEKSDLVTSLIILAVLTFDKVVIDNIGSSYSIKVKRKITYLVDELKSKGQIILYLSNSRTTLNISDPPDVKEVRFRDRFLPVETEYDLI